MASSSSTILDLHVVIYRPREGNYHHWAFWIYNTKTNEHRIYQVEGLENELKPTILPANPEGSERLIKKILVGHMRGSDLKQAAQAIKGVEVQNEVPTWDCQEYVIDIMDALEDIELLGSLHKYEAVKKAIKKMRGDIESTSRLVSRYDYEALDDEEEEEDDDGATDDEEGEEDDDGATDDDDVDPSQIRSAEMVEDSSDDD